jgi:glycosyl transferase family 4
VTGARLDIAVYGGRGIPSTYSGYETFLTVLLPELVKRGHRVTMYCRADGEVGETTFRGVERCTLPAVRTKSLETLTHGALSALVARTRGHDVVLVVNVANAAFCSVGRWTGQPTVLNTDGQEWLRGKWGPLGRRMFRLSARIARHGANALISDCAAMADIYATTFHARSTVIPYCWTDLPETDDGAVHARLRVAPGAYVCIAGRLVPENNSIPVVDAYLASDASWPLLVLGAANYDSPVGRGLRARAGGDGRLLVGGHVSDRCEFATIVRHAGLYVHAHSVGGINPSLVEAMGLGAFIYALDTPFNREALGGAAHLFGSFGPELVRLFGGVTAVPAADSARSRDAVAERARTVFAVIPVVEAYEALLLATAAAGRRSTVTITTPWAQPGEPARVPAAKGAP